MYVLVNSCEVEINKYVVIMVVCVKLCMYICPRHIVVVLNKGIPVRLYIIDGVHLSVSSRIRGLRS